MDKKPHFQSHSNLADMHGDGVHFNENLRAMKEAIDRKNEELNISKPSK